MAIDSLVLQPEPVLEAGERRIVRLNPIVSSVVIEGSKVKSRFLVILGGVRIPLRGKSFMYLTTLAVSRVRTEDGWVSKTDVEPGENQTKYFYQLRSEMRDVSEGDDVKTVIDYGHIIENDGLGNYRLGVDPSGIVINEENLRTFADYQVRRFFV